MMSSETPDEPPFEPPAGLSDERIGDRDGSDEMAREEESLWMEDGEVEEPGAETTVPVPVKIPGPGVFEAFGWLVGVIGVHVIASVMVVVMVALMVVVQSGDQQMLNSPERLQLAVKEHIGFVLGGDQFLFVIAALVAVGLRLAIPSDPFAKPWPRLVNRLGRQRIRWPHLLAIVFVVIPVSMACGQLFVVANRVWHGMLESMPGLPNVPTIQEVNILSDLAASMPLPVLVFVLAVLPAIGEELVFRGVIGRGLVARCGVVQGIFVTSLLFAVAHLHPAHQLSVFPLGVLLHVVYLATRSILAPILLHFLVNGWAAVLAKLSVGMGERDDGAELLAGDELIAWYVLVPAAVASLCAVVYFWRSRVEFREPSGDWWWPVYRSVESPPGPAESTRLKPPMVLVAVFCAALVCFYATAGWELSQLANGG
jgi:membrane protease YdiL (CAAX protease family)